MLIPIEELSGVKKVPCECVQCKGVFEISKSEARRALKGARKAKYCSHKCKNEYSNTQKEVICKNCSIIFKKQLKETKKSPNHFCNSSCSATYNNKNKTHGTRRSKLEIWLEEQLTSIYPTLKVDYNKKDAINSELDIYIPSLKLAFELNGIFHYEPIYGESKLDQIQNNDRRKFQACLERGIELCIIDVSSLKYFKPINAKKYLDIIIHILNKKSVTGETRTLVKISLDGLQDRWYRH